MGLGGGLVKSIVKSDDDKPAISGRRPRRVRATQKSIVKSDDDKPAISGRRPRHVRATRASRTVASATTSVAPMALVAQTLDHTGFNISSLGAHAGAR